MKSLRLFFLALALPGLIARDATTGTLSDAGGTNRKDLLAAVKHLENKLGFRRTKSFHKISADSAVSYRCYYTGKLELPESYEKLQLVQGTKAGCPLDANKFDLFFYPLEASGSGKSPISDSLQHESVERFLVVVPHEDFHAKKELGKLPVSWGEASSTLIGFLTATEVARQKYGENSVVYQNLRSEPDLFARKAAIVNHYHARLSELYASMRAGAISAAEAQAQKQQAFDELHGECTAITPEPKSFNRCLAASNNAGLAFDETYTKYYPIMYQLYLTEGRALKPTLEAIQRGLNVSTGAEALRYLRSAGQAAEAEGQGQSSR